MCYGDSSYLKSAYAAGCADFLKDPWTPEELYFRVTRSIPHRRITIRGEHLLVSGQTLSNENRQSIVLSYHESVLLRALSRQQGDVLTREALAYFLGVQTDKDSRLIDMHISTLRNKIRKLLPSGTSVNPIVSVRRIGYTLK